MPKTPADAHQHRGVKAAWSSMLLPLHPWSQHSVAAMMVMMKMLHHNPFCKLWLVEGEVEQHGHTERAV